jgi:hypothetical protein
MVRVSVADVNLPRGSVEGIGFAFFVQTLGGLAELIDPVPLHLVRMESSHPISKFFGTNLFSGPGRCFAAAKLGDTFPWVSFDFGEHSRFQLTGLAFSIPEVPRGKPQHTMKKTIQWSG